jgi:hypothetical protein
MWLETSGPLPSGLALFGGHIVLPFKSSAS